MHVSSRIIVLVAALALLTAACLSSHTSTVAAAPVRAGADNTPLYRWKLPGKGQKGDWIFGKGTASYDGESNAVLFMPYRPNGRTDFAVQATMRGLGPGGPEANLAGFGVVVRQNPSDPHTSISAGSFFSSNSEDNNPEIYWNGDTVGGEQLNPGTSWHLYRFEVQGSLYTLFIDGKQMVQYPIDDYPHATRIGIFSTYYKVEVKNVQVFGLSAPTQQPPAYPPTKPLVLRLADLPATTFYAPDLEHFYPNDEVARERGVTLASLEASGRLMSYGVDFEVYDLTVVDIYNSVTAFKTAAEAQADIPARLAVLHKQYSAQPNFHDLPANQVGDVSGGFTFDYSSLGYSFSLVTLLFARGQYETLVIFSTVAGKMSTDAAVAETLGLAKIVDTRIKQTG
jgi:hypothetical protein